MESATCSARQQALREQIEPHLAAIATVTNSNKTPSPWADVQPHLWKIVYQSPGPLYVSTQEGPTVVPGATELSQLYIPRIFRYGQDSWTAYHATGYGIANCTLVETANACLLIDTLGIVQTAQRVKHDFARFVDFATKPITAVVLTHSHIDHIGGLEAFVARQDVLAGKVKIYGQQHVQHGAAGAATIAPILGYRSLYTFGGLLAPEPMGLVNTGVGPGFPPGHISYLPPTVTFAKELVFEVGGLTVQLYHAPSECDDELFVWLPQLRLLQSADILMSQTFPNLHSLRGSPFRRPMLWYKAIDAMRRFPAEALAPSHGVPVEGRAYIAQALTAYRDAIQYVFDQTIRHMNLGATPDELVEIIKLPTHLAEHPWLQEYYGTVKHAVREIYQGILGWFTGDPTTLDPLPPVERATRYMQLMGGRTRLIDMAEEALRQPQPREWQWAAELLTYVLRVHPNDVVARQLKSQALQIWGYAQVNLNWRNWALMSASELLQPLRLEETAGLEGFNAPEILRGMALRDFFCLLGTRLRAEVALDQQYKVGIRTTQQEECVTVEVRRGVLQVHEGALADIWQFGLTAPKEVILHLFTHQQVDIEEVNSDTVGVYWIDLGPITEETVELTCKPGNDGIALLQEFRQLFDVDDPPPMPLTLR